MALGNDFNRGRSTGEESLRFPVAAGALIHRGAGLCRDAGGFLVPAGDVAGYRTAGVAYLRGLDNTGGAAGDDLERNLPAWMGSFLFDVATTDGGGLPLAVQPRECAPCYWLDDDTVVADPAATTHQILAGVLERRDEATGLWIVSFRIARWLDTLLALIQAAPATATLAAAIPVTSAAKKPATKKRTTKKKPSEGDS